MNVWARLGIAVLGFLAYGVVVEIRERRKFDRLLRDALVSDTERIKQLTQQVREWKFAHDLATGDPSAPDIRWSAEDFARARDCGIDLSCLYEDDRHQGDVL